MLLDRIKTVFINLLNLMDEIIKRKSMKFVIQLVFIQHYTFIPNPFQVT